MKENIMKCKACKSVEDYVDYMKNAPNSVISDMIVMFANKKKLWHDEQITLSKNEQKQLSNFQQAITKLSYTKNNDEFKNYVTI